MNFSENATKRLSRARKVILPFVCGALDVNFGAPFFSLGYTFYSFIFDFEVKNGPADILHQCYNIFVLGATIQAVKELNE